MKLVGIYDEAVFIAPKVYGVKSGTESYTKVKGLKDSKVTYNQLKSLLQGSTPTGGGKGNKLNFTQEKWHRDLSEGTGGY